MGSIVSSSCPLLVPLRLMSSLSQNMAPFLLRQLYRIYRVFYALGDHSVTQRTSMADLCSSRGLMERTFSTL